MLVVDADETDSQAQDGRYSSVSLDVPPSKSSVPPQPDPPVTSMREGLVPLSQLETIMLETIRTALNERNQGALASCQKDRGRPGKRVKDGLRQEKTQDTSEMRTTFLVSKHLKSESRVRQLTIIIQSATREIFKQAAGYDQDEEFAMHEPTSSIFVDKYIRREGSGLDAEDLHFDIKGGLGSEWNKKKGFNF